MVIKLCALIVLILNLADCATREFYVKNLENALKTIPRLDLDVLVTNMAALKDIKEIPMQFNEDINLNISQLINKYGFEFEEHRVLTKDGYKLGLHRIPGNGPPVLLMHGILASSDDFIVAGPKSATGYHLAKEGFDVWIANARGVKYSRAHVTLSPTKPEFWNFSFHEIGIYDLPALIDYVLEKTGKKKLNYIGYSQGGTSFFIMCSELPEYCDKISLNVVLSPVAWMTHIISPIIRIFFDLNLFSTLISLGQPEVFSNSVLGKALCTQDKLLKFICSNFLFLSFGFNQGQMNITNLPVILSHVPSGCSAKQFVHYKQSLYSGKFRFYDYGAEENFNLYGKTEPPDYKVDRTTAPTALFYSYSDWLSNILDVQKLLEKLPNVIDFYEAKHFSHIDYLYGKNLNVLNKRIVRLINKFW